MFGIAVPIGKTPGVLHDLEILEILEHEGIEKLAGKLGKY